ncbi:Zinc finger, RING/FYVE/PHD-type [Phytophthora cactorum]|nr:Zinc finger, RING/FYVE/PHD-type [Phytophthora cactorum]
MKSVTPFAAVHVTPEQTRRFESQARQLLDDTLREYDSHVAACKKGKNPLHDKWQWKPLKTHEGLNVYKERQPMHPELNPTTSRTTKTSAASASGHSANSLTERPAKPTQAVAMAAYTPEWRLQPVTGHIDGSLNDAMYGLMATDTAELQLRLRSMTDVEVHDTAMISCIQTPSTQEPFRFLGVQWLVRGEASRVKSSSRRPRDFVLLVASGVVQHRVPGSSESQEIGYYLCQSVEMQECGELESQGLTRGWMSTCSLFTPAKGSSAQIDVFSRGYVDFKGKMQDYQAAGMMTTLMLAGVTEQLPEFRRMQPEAKASSNHCGICERKFGVLNSVASCNLCQVNMCSRCRVSRNLSFVKRRDTATSLTQSRSWDEGQQASGQVRCLTMVLCKNCKMNASHMDARVMARREVEAAYGLNELARTAPVSGIDTPLLGRYIHQMRFWTPGTDTAKMGGRDDKQLDDVVKPRLMMVSRMDSGKSNFSDSSARSKLESSVSSFASTLPSPRDRDSSQEESSFELTPFQPRHQHQPQYTSEDPEITYTYAPQRMQELQIKSESVYQFTSQMNANTRYRHQQFVPPNSSTSISELD